MQLNIYFRDFSRLRLGQIFLHASWVAFSMVLRHLLLALSSVLHQNLSLCCAATLLRLLSALSAALRSGFTCMGKLGKGVHLTQIAEVS